MSPCIGGPKPKSSVDCVRGLPTTSLENERSIRPPTPTARAESSRQIDSTCISYQAFIAEIPVIGRQGEKVAHATSGEGSVWALSSEAPFLDDLPRGKYLLSCK